MRCPQQGGLNEGTSMWSLWWECLNENTWSACEAFGGTLDINRLGLSCARLRPACTSYRLVLIRWIILRLPTILNHACLNQLQLRKSLSCVEVIRSPTAKRGDFPGNTAPHSSRANGKIENYRELLNDRSPATPCTLYLRMLIWLATASR